MSKRKQRRDAGRSSAVGADDALETLVNQFSDPLVFLRELVQNSLDAASTLIDVVFEYATEHGLMTIRVTDNGEGMNESVIDRYLLTLFRSTKENDLTKIGKFGVGFVSIFALKPDLVVLETGQTNESWRIIFHADRSFEKLRLDEPVEGTSIALHKQVSADAFEDLRRRGADTLRYWCKYAEADIQVDGESIGQEFNIQAWLGVGHEEPGTELVIGFAPPRVAEDTERLRLSGREAATALTPVIGFYNRGLTLVESSEPPNQGNRESEFLAGLSARIKSRYLEHTLTRDNVRQDDNYAKALALLRKHAEGPLRARLLAHLQALASHYSGLGAPAPDGEHPGAPGEHPGAPDDQAHPGAPDIELALLYARLPSMRLHEVAADAPILPAVTGAPVSVRQVREAKTPTGTVLCASAPNPVTELLRARGVPVILDIPAVRAHLQTLEILGVASGQGDRDNIFAADMVLVTSVAVECTPAQRACLDRVHELLGRAKVKTERVLLGDLAYPNSVIARDFYLRQERAHDLTMPGQDDQVTWLGGARDLVFNTSHALVANAMELAALEPTLAAQLLAQAVCTWEAAEAGRVVDLARSAMQWKRAQRDSE